MNSTEPRRLKLMADQFCWALWEDEPEKGLFDNVDPATLPLSPETIRDLARWIDVFSEGAKSLPDGYFWSDERTKRFEAEGLRLWRQVRRELGPAFRVSYKHHRRQEPEDDPV